MPPVSLADAVVIDQFDLFEAAEKIRPTNSALADLLEAVEEVDADGMHTMVEYPDSAPECVDDCPPCVARYSAQLVAAEYLRAIKGGGES